MKIYLTSLVIRQKIIKTTMTSEDGSAIIQKHWQYQALVRTLWWADSLAIQRCSCLVLGVHLTLYGKKEFAYMTKLGILKWEDYSGFS